MLNRLWYFLCLSIKDFLQIRNKTVENSTHLRKAIHWLESAQCATDTDGVAAYYSLQSGWSHPFIETTGYILSTFLLYSRLTNQKKYRVKAIKMGEYLLTMQLPGGGFRTHPPTKLPHSTPTVFNTGQDILGLCDLYTETKKSKFLKSAQRAADFLCRIQEKDGSWLNYTYGNSKHSFDSRVAWSLLKVYKLTKTNKYKQAAISNLEWILRNQHSNGWFSNSHLPTTKPNDPITHTMAYVAEGLLWSGKLLKNDRFINAAQKELDAFCQIFENTGTIFATYNSDWKPTSHYHCLTGTAQIANLLLTAFLDTGIIQYKTIGLKLTAFLKSTQDLDHKDPGVSGGIKGSLPIYGDLWRNFGYCRFSFINWGTKFFADALIKEELIEGNFSLKLYRKMRDFA